MVMCGPAFGGARRHFTASMFMTVIAASGARW
jgi:hypothetical protein